MKRKLISVLCCVTVVFSLFAGCGAGDTAVDAETSISNAGADEATDAAEDTGGIAVGHTYAIVTESADNPFSERTAQSFQEVIEAEGGTCIVKRPASPSADAQITEIQSLISEGVDCICVAANDENALQTVLEEAMADGIKVFCLDSRTNPDSRMTFVNKAGTMEIGQALMDAVYDLCDGEGQWAILSAAFQAENQNAWIAVMQEVMGSDPKYANLKLVETAFGDDDPQKCADQTNALLASYPELKVICAPTTVGIAAAAEVLQAQGSSVKLTGLGIPSEMAEYIGDDDAHSCPYMFLWNPIDLGRLGAYTSIALVDGSITGAAGETFEAGSMEASPYTIVDADDGGTEIILGQPFRFDAGNINEWKDVY